MNTQISTPAMKAFVIGPIGDKDAEDGSPARTSYEEGIQVFEDVIAPACTAFGLEAVRADMITRTGEIPEQIFRQLRDCPVVIADLTGANPNVMYELGLRHTTGRVTIQIGEKGRLPFDVAAIRTIMFKRTEAGIVQARKDLSKSLAANLDTGGDPVTATRIWFEAPSIEQKEPDPQTTGVASPASDEDAPGFLELFAEMETGTQSLVQTMVAAASIIEDIIAVYTEATASIRQAEARGGGASVRLAIAELAATKLNEQAARLEVVSGEFARTVDRIEPGIQYLLGRLAEEPDQLAAVPDFPLQVKNLCDAARSSIEGSNAMRVNAIEIGKASRSLKRAGERLAPSFKRFSDTSGRVADWSKLLERFPPLQADAEESANGHE
ncbi:hypothetical protein QTH89_05185 [Variovorax sp. J22G21]|uniref:hypothetical protein n=1 Tax=Variovorax fucosicus TaxID=3053517 RepID=UPI0025777C81|nr:MULTISPECIES: hypothetical protein [unclassified Variovorax]MDM0041539.1 hypothetical protein [Variovorax sp. J22R193]MDM0060595.1 hypothetical protein [Variovorax sp. J22G21]